MRYQLPLKYLDTVARVGSIRKAADQLAITASALNRRIIAMEEDLGLPIFDRVAKGVQLNAAGELFIHHIRSQLADMERVKSQIHDLQGVRRGHVSIACSQALMVTMLPTEIHKYQQEHPEVTFSVKVCTRHTAISDLESFSADLAVVFEPESSAGFQSRLCVPKQLYAQFSASHELNGEGTLRLRDCLNWPLALPTKSNGIRYLLEQSAASSSSSLNVSIESDNFHLLRQVCENSNLVSFTLDTELSAHNRSQSMSYRPIDLRDIQLGMLHVGQLKDRHLPVAAAKFLDQLEQNYQDG
ncbi:MAG: LysR family transcriptional regulator [Gammaproteobacteria bacterium]|nr:LysR family transcriptional regulator [Gammaproteobacteria bacterium]